MTFRRYAAERIGITALFLFLCACLSYVCFHLIGMSVNTRGWLPYRLANYHHFRNESFGSFLWKLVGHASLGHDLADGRSLTGEITSLAPPTLSVALGALVFSMLIGLPLGLAWSRRPRPVRLFASPFVFLMFGLVPVWVGLLLSYHLGYQAKILPIAGYCPLVPQSHRYSGCSGPVQWMYHLILPSVIAGFLLAAVHAVVVQRLADGIRRASDLPTAARADAVRAARRHAQVAYAKLVARNWFWLIGATLFAEVIFNLEGLAQAFLDSYYRSAPEWAEGILLFTTLITIGGWLVIDLIGAAISSHWREL